MRCNFFPRSSRNSRVHVVGWHSPAGCWRPSIVDRRSLNLVRAHARVKDADRSNGITWGLVLRREDSADRTRSLEQFRGDGIQDDMATRIRLLLLSVLFVGSLYAIPGRLSGMWTCFSRLASGVVTASQSGRWSGVWWIWRGVIWFRRLVNDFGEWFCRNCNPGNESISLWINENSRFASRFLKCLNVDMAKCSYIQCYERLLFNQDSLCYRWNKC